MNSDIISATLAKIGSLWPSMLLILIAAGTLLYFRGREKAKLAHLDIKNIDRLDMDSFEKYLSLIFKQKGFSLVKEKDINKFKADFIAESQDKRIFIHVLSKRNSLFGVQDARDAIAYGEASGCDETMLVTNGFLNKAAISLVKVNHITSWDQKKLIQELEMIKR
jgi:HJR/Mrr/RecB family endonuclease